MAFCSHLHWLILLVSDLLVCPKCLSSSSLALVSSFFSNFLAARDTLSGFFHGSALKHHECVTAFSQLNLITVRVELHFALFAGSVNVSLVLANALLSVSTCFCLRFPFHCFFGRVFFLDEFVCFSGMLLWSRCQAAL